MGPERKSAQPRKDGEYRRQSKSEGKKGGYAVTRTWLQIQYVCMYTSNQWTGPKSNRTRDQQAPDFKLQASDPRETSSGVTRPCKEFGDYLSSSRGLGT
jgi:hypothetical protein